MTSDDTIDCLPHQVPRAWRHDHGTGERRDRGDRGDHELEPRGDASSLGREPESRRCVEGESQRAASKYSSRRPDPLPTGTECLPPEQCNLAFEPGYRTHTASTTSDGIGLDTVRKAVHAAHGRAWLATALDDAGGHRTIFHLILPVEIRGPRSEPSSSESRRAAASKSDAAEEAHHLDEGDEASSHVRRYQSVTLRRRDSTDKTASELDVPSAPEKGAEVAHSSSESIVCLCMAECLLDSCP